MTARTVSTAAAVTGLLVAAAVGWLLGAGSVAGFGGVETGGAALLRLTVPAARFLLDACGVAAVGIGMLGWLVADGQRRDADAVLGAASRGAVVLAGGWTATALLLLWLQTAEVAGRSPADLGVGTVATYVRAFNSGVGLLLTAACAVAYGVIAATTRGRSWPELPTVVALLGLIQAPLTGHAPLAPAHELAVVSITAHVIGVAVWVGGLGALLTAVAARRGLLATALPRFSTIAAAALAAVAVSGVTTAVVRVGSAAALLDTGYGRVVLAKTAALLALAVLGYLVRRRVLPAVERHQRAPLLAVAGTELVLMAVAIGLAAALTRSG